ncbi:unnamed protein product [Caenorhabditis bovis]|uniref:Uncharacterized protein n=1 Tax=Caenorhabditis bovis TaxID=2654633 RepID=A0A8S1ESV5_9PELO|nr:unnamed protein product [Caenorhabditis bovis]
MQFGLPLLDWTTAEKSFEWVDPYMTEEGEFNFLAGRPDGVTRGTERQDCLTMYASLNSYYHGFIDDQL